MVEVIEEVRNSIAGAAGAVAEAVTTLCAFTEAVTLVNHPRSATPRHAQVQTIRGGLFLTRATRRRAIT